MSDNPKYNPKYQYQYSSEFKPSEYDPANLEQQGRLTHVTNLAVSLRNHVQTLLIVGGEMDAPEHRADLHGAVCMLLADFYPNSIDEIVHDVKKLLATLHPGQRAIPPTYVRAPISTDAPQSSPIHAPLPNYNIPEGTDKTLIHLLIHIAAKRNWEPDIKSQKKPEIKARLLYERLMRLHFDLHCYANKQTGIIPWTRSELVEAITGLVVQPHIPDTLRDLYRTLQSTVIIYAAQMDMISQLKRYDLEIAGARSAKDRVVARHSKALILSKSQAMWGNDWTKLFGYEPIPIDPIEPHLLSDADRDEMIPKQSRDRETTDTATDKSPL